MIEDVEAVEMVEFPPMERPFLTTDFSDYTVTEGLLLVLVLLVVLSFCGKLLREGFYWL